MATKTLDDLPEAEQAKFLNVCAEAGIAPEEFNVSFTEEIAGDYNIKTCGRSIVVQLGNTTRAYENAVDVPWTVLFEEDMKARVFG